MTLWEEEVNRRLDQIAVDADDWDSVVDMLAEVTESSDTFYDYLGYLETRVKWMRRRMNRVTFHPEGTRHFRIWNYDYETYKFFEQHYPEQYHPTAFYIAIPFDNLEPKHRDWLQQKVEPL